MSKKEAVKKVLKATFNAVKNYLIDLARNLWEDYLKEELKTQITTLVARGANLAHAYHGSEDYEKKKEIVVNFIFKNIKLPKWLVPLKGLVKLILSNFIETQIDKAFGVIDNYLDKNA